MTILDVDGHEVPLYTFSLEAGREVDEEHKIASQWKGHVIHMAYSLEHAGRMLEGLGASMSLGDYEFSVHMQDEDGNLHFSWDIVGTVQTVKVHTSIELSGLGMVSISVAPQRIVLNGEILLPEEWGFHWGNPARGS